MSKAWLSLSSPALKILILFLDKRQREPQKKAKARKGEQRLPKFTNADHIKLTYLELQKKYHFAQQRLSERSTNFSRKGLLKSDAMGVPASTMRLYTLFHPWS